jgi:hypothetical protein
MKMDELEAELAQFEKDVGSVSPNDVNPMVGYYIMAKSTKQIAITLMQIRAELAELRRMLGKQKPERKRVRV